MRGALGVVVLVAALAGIAVAVFFIVRRQRYLAAVRERGWTHDSNPALGTVLDLAAPPFGLGLAREVDELVTGTTPAGFSFRVFAWKYSGARSKKPWGGAGSIIRRRTRPLSAIAFT